jgi:hypothetical protein
MTNLTGATGSGVAWNEAAVQKYSA